MKVWQCYNVGNPESSIKTLDELIEVLTSVREEHGNLNLGNDKHWRLSLDILPSGCLVGTKEDGNEALDIECDFID